MTGGDIHDSEEKSKVERQGQRQEVLKPGSYGVIYADPPWEFKTRSVKGQQKSPQRHYECMKTEDIAALPIGQYAAKDCALFIWATWPMIFDAQKVIEGWGFRYSGLAWEWLKFNFETEKFAFGGGYGTRKNLEPLLLARKGRPVVLRRDVRDFLFAQRREHSRKPDENYTRIESMFAGPYLELFARQSRPGWDVWGNQVDKFNFEEGVFG
jgi:N6-adenosine-specific RNA methylase IME4